MTNCRPTTIRALTLSAVACVLTSGTVRASQSTPKAPPPPDGQKRTVVVVAGPRYKAGALHRLLFGPHYRSTWTAPVTVEVLDLHRFAGGLTPLKKGGGKQTKALGFRGKDGAEYRFRSVDKDPTPTLPEDLQDSVADWIVQDQISAAHPAGPLVVEVLSEAAGIWHPHPRMFVMPDDPALGEFRKEFAGMLGILEENADKDSAAFAEATEIIDSGGLIKKLDAGPADRVDTPAFLKARLFDDFIGDWDRHWDQWDWAKKPGHDRWVPIPKDRDQAFAKFDGLLLAAARSSQPRFVDFEPEYPTMVGLNWNAQYIDRRLLTDLEWPAWQEIARELQSRLTDAVIDDAVRKMPPEYYELTGPSLAATLKGRRDRLPQAARDFYELLARQVAVQATDRADVATAVRGADGQLELTLANGAGGAEPYYRRRFFPAETEEVRVFLAGDNDKAITQGSGADQIKLRVIGGKGDDVLDDSAAGKTEFFDFEGRNLIVHGPGTSDSDKPYETPRDRLGNPLRDWGHHTLLTPIVSGGGDLGLLLGLGIQRTHFGFRKHPWAGRQSVRGAWSTAQQGARLDYEGEWQRTNSRKRIHVFARASDIEIVRFHGFGNEQDAPADGEFYKNQQRQFVLAPSLTVPLAGLRLMVGPIAKYATTRQRADSFLGQNEFYGEGDFGQVGGRARLFFDHRNHPQAPSRGIQAWTEATYYPGTWSVREGFGSVYGEASTYLRAAMPLQPTLALRAGGKQLWGDYPFHEAAFIGGPDTVRGLRRQRYAGDASLFGNVELRLRLARPTILVPTDVGVFGLADAGRVYFDGEASDQWHTGVGGGVWFSFYRPQNTFSLAVATSEGRTRLYFQGGLSF
jgi:hypothetical protein